ncbi:hypothetical protein SERLA73DRAFT_181976, partial [Serpula lacrymans var. lacrymans S7.3]
DVPLSWNVVLQRYFDPTPTSTELTLVSDIFSKWITTWRGFSWSPAGNLKKSETRRSCHIVQIKSPCLEEFITAGDPPFCLVFTIRRIHYQKIHHPGHYTRGFRLL